MGRPMGVDTWCAQKHVMTAEGHLEEVLTKLYREAPDSSQIPFIQSQVRELMNLRELIVDNLGSLSQHELGFDDKGCDRCVDDFNLNLDDEEIDDSHEPDMLKNKIMSFGDVTQLLNINSGRDDGMAKGNLMNGVKDLAIVNLAQASGVLVNVVGQKFDASGKTLLNKKPSFWINVVGGLALQVVGVTSKTEAIKILGLVAGSQMLSSEYRLYLSGVKAQQINHTPRSTALNIRSQQEVSGRAADGGRVKAVDPESLVQVD